MPTSVSVIVPAYHEEAGVGLQVRAIRQALRERGISHEILVVDDGSQDRTADVALLAGAQVLRHPENRGYGASIKTGIAAAQYEAIAIIDADGTYPSEQIPLLLEELETADMVVGARIGENVHIPWARRPAKALLRWLAERITKCAIPDLNSGLRVFRAECAKQYFSILSDKFSFTTTITIAFLVDGYRVVYRPIDYYPRIGKSKITPSNFTDFLILILRMSMMFEPLRVFIPLSVLFFYLGVAKVVFDIVTLFIRYGALDWSLLYQPVLSTSSILLLIMSAQLLLIGMVADGLVRRVAQYNRARAPSHGAVISRSLRAVQSDEQEAQEALAGVADWRGGGS